MPVNPETIQSQENGPKTTQLPPKLERFSAGGQFYLRIGSGRGSDETISPMDVQFDYTAGAQ